MPGDVAGGGQAEGEERRYGVSVVGDTVLLWRKAGGTYSVYVIARRGMSEDDVMRLLSGDPEAARELKEDAGAFEALLARYEEEMREAGYGDVVDLVRALLAAASILA